jgi:hypothetical protein
VPYLRLFHKRLLGVLAACSLAVVPSAAGAFSPYLVVPEPGVAEASPAYRYANMTDAAALAELSRRGVLYSAAGPAPGVRAPIRLTGRLHGVYIHSALPPEQRVRSPFEILDARLALALDDFCALLERHDIDEVVHYTMYRPAVAAPLQPLHGVPDDAPGATAQRPAGARPRAPLGAPARKAGKATPARSPHRGMPRTTPAGGIPPGTRLARRDPVAAGIPATTWAPPGTRHPAGLAIDAAMFHKRDGRWLSVQRDFHGRVGAKTCGEGVPVPENPDARELRALVCESSALGLFTYVLTPDYNAAHADHFHMEVKPGVRWFLYH